jgi:hypothetical protein
MVLKYALRESGVIAAMTDVVDPGCMTARYLSTSHAYSVPISVEGLSADNGLSVEELNADATFSGPRFVAPDRWAQASFIYRVPLPSDVPAGVYRLVFFDRCLSTVQYLTEVVHGNPVVRMYGRWGDVVAVAGDYKVSQIEHDGGDLAQTLTALQAGIDARVKVAGDLGTPQRATGLQGRPVVPTLPADGAELVWSAANARWELQ